MTMRFKITQYITDYVKVGEEYRTVEVRNKFAVDTWDDLQNLFLTLIDFTDGKIKFEVEKEVTE